jgi:hypothetical protein
MHREPLGFWLAIKDQYLDGSSDITPIENSFQVPKEHIKKFTHNDIEGLIELALKGWARLK